MIFSDGSSQKGIKVSSFDRCGIPRLGCAYKAIAHPLDTQDRKVLAQHVTQLALNDMEALDDFKQLIKERLKRELAN